MFGVVVSNLRPSNEPLLGAAGSTFTSGSAVAAGSAFAPPAGPSAPVPLATVGVSASAAGFSTGSASGGHMSGLPAFIQAYRSVVFLKGLLFRGCVILLPRFVLHHKLEVFPFLAEDFSIQLEQAYDLQRICKIIQKMENKISKFS